MNGRRLAHRSRVAVGRLGALAERSLSEFFADGCPQRAAAISFYALLALFPLAILCVAVFGLVVSEGDARRQVVDFLLDKLPLEPGEGRDRLNSVLNGVTTGSGTLGIVAIAGLIVSASGLMGALRHALNAAWDAEELRRPPLQGKLLDIALVFAAGLFVGLSLTITLAMRLAGRAGETVGGVGEDTAQAVLALGALLPLGLSFGVFLMLFKVVPARDVRVRDAWPGALLAAIGYELAKTGFAFYLANFGNYSAVYGSIGAVIALMVFVFVAANVFLLGAEMASEWPAVRSTPEHELMSGEGLKPKVRGLLRKLVSRDA